MTDIVERLRDADIRHGSYSVLVRDAADEIERLTLENWQLKGALGYPVPGNIPDNGPWKCGLCEAKTISIMEAADEIERLRAALAKSCREDRAEFLGGCGQAEAQRDD